LILFIDDERRVMDSYREYLAMKVSPEGYDVIFLDNIDPALGFLENRGDEIDLIILDVMMPTGTKLDREQTSDGLMTGVVFYDLIRKKLPTLPILVFTNYSDEDVERRLQNDPNCRFLQKTDYLLEDFVSEVRNLLAASSER
jgi:CheY-like chemotaxis protein